MPRQSLMNGLVSWHRTFVPHLAAALLVTAQCACLAQTSDRPDVTEPTEAHQIAGEGDGEAHWGYEGETGSDRWGRLDPAFALCDTGLQQSPVELASAIPASADSLAMHWRPADAQVLDNGHTIQVDVAEGSYIALADRRFSLLQLHFHLPSEHAVGGKRSPMEVHFVHRSAEGDLAVIGVFMYDGKAHPGIQSIWDAIPDDRNVPASLTGFNPNALLPESLAHFRYAGSLTTPPCSEVVSWVVMTDSISVSQAQISAFAERHSMNARPVQPLNRRFVLLRQ